ncbi:MAG: 2-oxo acid dehydrogenase subunit E2 [Firmicutes bacterium HGW-Firmicutes-1]|jgi:pyruvate dehydrogenase E2 component (dihydrolipoamide acetyltransferase)|nr:MAG: 2-oxo acid dehydrogenase subunit E2 [Firmicutes bacterium HGW-Firmicutes-1]
MATAIIMPRQGQSVESCIITKWHKAVGDQVKEGDVLFTYETDKASFEEESSVGGTVLVLLFQEDDDVPCLKNVCLIGNQGEDISAFVSTNIEDTKEEIVHPEVVASETKEVFLDQEEIKTSYTNKISPRAKNLASKLSIDYQRAQATGPNDRVIERDILKLKEQGVFATSAALASGQVLPATGSGIGGRTTVGDLGSQVINETINTSRSNAPVPKTTGYREEKISNVRKFIAKAMHASLATTAQLTLNTSFDATELMEIRKKLKKDKFEYNITLNDMILFAVSRVLKDYELLNAHFVDDTMKYFENVHLGIAVDTDRGLLVPTLFNADQKSLVQMSVEVKDLAEKSKQGSISPDYLTGASFTITNLGTLGVESFTPVINPPQTGILGVNTIITRVREENGVISTYPAMGLSLTFDHRAIDGAPAARFLKALTNALESFTMLLMK